MPLIARKQCVATAVLLTLALGCTGNPTARLSVLGVSPEASSVRPETKDITIFVSYAISAFNEALAPYTVSIQFDRHDGLTIGPAFGASNAVISSASGQVRLVVSVKEVLALHLSDGLSLPITAHVIVDHVAKGGTKIIGKSGPIRLPLLGTATPKEHGGA